MPCGVRCLSRQAGRRGPNTSCCRAGSAAADEQGDTVHRCQRFAELATSNRRLTVALCPSLEFSSHIASKARCAKLTFTSRVLLTQFIDDFTSVKLPRPSVVVDELTRLAPCCHRQHCRSAASLRLAPGLSRGQLSLPHRFFLGNLHADRFSVTRLLSRGASPGARRR